MGDNNKGGVKSSPCHIVAKNIWEWAIERNNILSAQHLPGKENTVADRASRIFDVNTEWSLSNSIFEKIESQFGSFEIDLFASRLNKKCKKFISWKPDPEAYMVDAFLTNWGDIYFYAFPPFSVIMMALTKIEADQATGVIVCPLWRTQAWFPKLMGMVIEPPLLLPHGILSLPFQQEARHKQKNLRLMACRVSGKSSLVEAFQKGLPKLCAHHREGVHPNSTGFTLENGLISAVNDKLIPYNSMK